MQTCRLMDRKKSKKIHYSAQANDSVSSRHTICQLRRNVGQIKLEMWANAQRDGRPVGYRWHPVFNAEKFGPLPLLEYRAVTLPRHETALKFAGVPQTTGPIYA